MHHSTRLTCHCEERSDVAISQYPAGQQESHRRNRNCLPEIAPQGHFLALRAQGATAPLGPRNDKSRGLAPPDHKKCAAEAALPRSERHGALRPQRPAPWGYLSYRPRQFYAARRT